MHFYEQFLFFACAILVALRCVDWRNSSDVSEMDDRETTFLVIGVVSAQNNSAARFSIRHTWKTLIKTENVKFFFIIGQETCSIPPIDRKCELSCEPLHLLDDIALENPKWTPDLLVNYEGPKKYVTSFTFHVNFPVVLRSIRISTGTLSKSSVAIVNVRNARTGTPIISTIFQTTDHVSGNDTNWMEAHQKPFLLPKSFDAEVQLVIEGNQNLDSSVGASLFCFGRSLWFNMSGAIEFTTQFSPDTGWVAFDDQLCSPVSVLLELHEAYSHLLGKESRGMHWREEVALLSERLRSEAKSERDIAFVNIVDVYRNIPKKLMKFYEWIHQKVNFTFLLKSDDDTFLDILAIQNFLQSVDPVISSQMWWWGSFRHGLPVERHGKWQELVYAAPVYPPFPCGGGYVINWNIVNFIVSNAKWLHRFQGEDTSLGIWLSAVHPFTPQNATCNWKCGLDCDKRACNRGQLSPESMLSVWHVYRESGNLC